MNKSLKAHFNRYIFYYIFLALLLIPICMLIIAFVKDLKLYLDEKDKLPDYTEQVKQLYEINPDLFEFDGDNIFILKMDYLLETVINGKIIRIVEQPHLNKNQEQCVGYLIVKKNDNGEFIVDNSHICDIMNH